MKKFKLLALAAAGVMAVTAVTASAVGISREKEEVKFTEFEEQLLCGTYPIETVSEEEQARVESSWKTAKLLKEGVIDRASPDATIIGEDGLTDLDRQTYNIAMGSIPAPVSVDELYEDELNAIIAAEQSVVMKLTKNTSITKYTQWEGRFIVDNLSDNTYSFIQPAYFSIKIADGKNATMTSADKYTSRYKRVTAYARYLKSDNSTELKTATKKGSGAVLTAFPDKVNGAKLVETTVFFYVYKGDDDTTEIEEAAFVHIVDSSYAKSAQYAENPYAHLIDQYTHIEN